MIYLKRKNGEDMKRKRLIVVVLTIILMLVGCIVLNVDKIKKSDEKTTHKEQSKKVSQEQENSVDTSISSMFMDDELWDFASENINALYQERMSYICGTHFATGEESIRVDDQLYAVVSDPQVKTYDDIENVYYQKFSRRYPICYDKPYNLSPLTTLPFIEQDGMLYESYKAICIYGIGSTYTVGEITNKTEDEFWVRLNSYCSLDDSTNQTDITCSFVWEDGEWKYGDFNNPQFYKVG